MPAEARADGLLAEFPPQPARVLLAQADRARRTLADGLAAGGHTVESVIAYRTVARRPSPDEVTMLTSADAVLLASGSAAAAWAEAIGDVAAPPLIAIGPVTASDAASAGPHDRPRRDVTGRFLGVRPAGPGHTMTAMPGAPFPVDRPRRLRRTPALRDLVAETVSCARAT